MRPTPFYFFEYLPPGAKKPKRTTYRMTIETAAERFPGAVPIESTKEIRNLDEPGTFPGPSQHSRQMAGFMAGLYAEHYNISPVRPGAVQTPAPETDAPK